MKTAPYPKELARYFRQHNLRVVGLALGATLGAGIAWGVLFLALHWGRLMVSALNGEWDRNLDWMPWPGFVSVITIVLIGQMIHRGISQRLEGAHWWFTLFGMLLLPARFTFAVFTNLSAFVRPTERDREHCWRLLEELLDQQKIPYHGITPVLPPGVDSVRLVYLLAITELAATDEYGGVFYLHFRNENARRLVRRWRKALDEQQPPRA